MLTTERIMLIENNPKDTSDILSIINSIDNRFKWTYFKAPQEASEYLKNGNDLPHLILLESGSNNHDSIEFIKTVKKDTNLKRIPIVIISPSNEPTQVFESFHNGVAGYMVKPQDDQELTDVINTIINYWNMCILPSA